MLVVYTNIDVWMETNKLTCIYNEYLMNCPKQKTYPLQLNRIDDHVSRREQLKQRLRNRLNNQNHTVDHSAEHGQDIFNTNMEHLRLLFTCNWIYTFIVLS